MLLRFCQSCHLRRWMRPAVALVLALVTGMVPATSELPSLGENSAFNIARETRLGASVYDRILAVGLVETNPILDRYINDLGHRLLAGLDMRLRDYRFFIMRDDSVNAFALPGGFIGVNRGLIAEAQTQHQLASVMAHEIAHVRLMHGMDQMKKGGEVNTATILTMLAGLLLGTVDSQAGSAVLFGGVAAGQQAMVNFTRENEYEADRIGIELMHDANFDTNGMVEFFTIMTRLAQAVANSVISSTCARTQSAATVLPKLLPGSGINPGAETRSIIMRYSRITLFMSAARRWRTREASTCGHWQPSRRAPINRPTQCSRLCIAPTTRMSGTA